MNTIRHAVKSAAGCIYSMVSHFCSLMMLQTPLRLTSWIVHRHLTKLTNLQPNFVQRISKLQHFLLRSGLKFHLMYIERIIMDHNHFTEISVVNSYPVILGYVLHTLGCCCSAANCTSVPYVIMNELTTGIAAPITAVEQKRIRRLLHVWNKYHG